MCGVNDLNKKECIHSNSAMLSEETTWQVMLKEAEEFDRSESERFEASPEYLEWFNARPQSVRDAMNLMPRDGYYTDAKTQKKVYRVYGVVEDLESGVCSYHVVQAMVMRFRMCVLNAHKLLRIERWTEDHLSVIRLSMSPEVFIDPNGWVIIASMVQEEKTDDLSDK